MNPDPERRVVRCPRCHAQTVRLLPVTSSDTRQQWCECNECRHLWTMPVKGRPEDDRGSPAPAAEVRRASTKPDAPTVLVIDDVEATRTGLAELLRLRGYNAREAESGAAGLRLLRSEPDIRVIVLDLLMPGTDGYWFREQQLADPAIAHIPVIVFTGAKGAQRVEDLKVQEVLYKPVSVDKLFEAISRYCRP